MKPKIHSTSEIHSSVAIGEDTQVWMWCQIRERSILGKGCILGKGVYVDSDVKIGDLVKVGNNASIFRGVTIDNAAFIGPHVCFTNDLHPRSTNPDGTIKGTVDWKVTETFVETGASVGANSTVVCGVRLGRWSLVAAGSVVTRDVPAHALVRGNPARVVGYVCYCGKKLEASASGVFSCHACGSTVDIKPKINLRKEHPRLEM